MAPVLESHSAQVGSIWGRLLAPLGHPYSAVTVTVVLLVVWAASRRRKQSSIPNDYMTKQLLNPPLVSDLPPPLRSTIWQHRDQRVAGENILNQDATHATNTSSYRYSDYYSEKGPWRRHSYPVSTADSDSPTQVLSHETKYRQCIEADNSEEAPKPMLWRRRTIVFESPFPVPIVDVAGHSNGSGPDE
jgi:hypothetical protein